jgi:hypothetical protein
VCATCGSVVPPPDLLVLPGPGYDGPGYDGPMGWRDHVTHRLINGTSGSRASSSAAAFFIGLTQAR